MPDASPEFKQQLKEAFAAMYEGQTFVYRRTFTEGDVTLFCGVTGDFNPYHMDEEFARQSWYGRRNIPGLLTGSMMTHIGGLIGFLATDMTFEFLGSVYVGDTITCTVTITEKNQEKRRVYAVASYVNQAGNQVLKTTFSGFPGQMRLAR